MNGRHITGASSFTWYRGFPMKCLGLFLVWLSVVLSSVSVLLAAERDPPAAGLLVGLSDTIRPLPTAISSADLETKQGWQRVAEEKLDHRFRGDAILWNRRVAAVLRTGSPGVEVYSRGPNGWKRQAILIPAGADGAKELLSVKTELLSVKTVANDAAAVAVEGSFRTGDGKLLGLVCQLTPEATFVRAEARSDTKRLRIQAAGRFGVIPDFCADDITLDAAKIPLAKVCIPSENMVAHLLEGDRTLPGRMRCSVRPHSSTTVR